MKLITTLILSLIISFSANASPDLNISFKTAKGEVKLSDFNGQVIYLDFWASWCIPCRKSFPWMNSLQNRYGNKGFKVIAVNLDQEAEEAKAFLDKIPANFIIAYDPEGISAKKLKVKGMPSSYLIDRAGKVVSSHIGFREKEIPEMEHKIKSLLKK